MNGYRESGSRPCAILGGGRCASRAAWAPSDVIRITPDGSIRAQTDSGIVEILVVGGENVVSENRQFSVSVFDLAAHSPSDPDTIEGVDNAVRVVSNLDGWTFRSPRIQEHGGSGSCCPWT